MITTKGQMLCDELVRREPDTLPDRGICSRLCKHATTYRRLLDDTEPTGKLWQKMFHLRTRMRELAEVLGYELTFGEDRDEPAVIIEVGDDYLVVPGGEVVWQTN